MKELHPIQNRILSRLLFAESLKFTELKPYKIENSQFLFHVDKLTKDELIIKNEDGYSLTQKGKEFANRMDTVKEKMIQQAKVTTILCCERIIDNKIQYLIYTRYKNPFYGYSGFPTHKVWFGEKIKNAAEIGLLDECNLQGEAKLIAIRHYHLYLNNELMEDKIMHIFKFDNPIGELKNLRDGEFQWIDKDAIKFDKKLPEFNDVIEILEGNDKSFFKESEQFVDTF
jgi:hypothetical protein